MLLAHKRYVRWCGGLEQILSTESVSGKNCLDSKAGISVPLTQWRAHPEIYNNNNNNNDKNDNNFPKERISTTPSLMHCAFEDYKYLCTSCFGNAGGWDEG